MGDINRILGWTELGDRLMADRLCIDFSEDIHLHQREFRLDLGTEEFLFLKEIFNIDIPTNYEEEKYDLMKQVNITIPKKSEYFNSRFQIEEQKNGIIHIHWRDLRIELSKSEFIKIAETFKEALERLK